MAKTKPDSSKPVVAPGSTTATAPDQTNEGASQQGGDTSTSNGVATGAADAATIAAGAVQPNSATSQPGGAAPSETQPQPVPTSEAISFPVADEDADRARAALAASLQSMGLDLGRLQGNINLEDLLQGNTQVAEDRVETRRFEVRKPVRHNNVFFAIGALLRVTREEHDELAGAGVVDPDWDEDED